MDFCVWVIFTYVLLWTGSLELHAIKFKSFHQSTLSIWHYNTQFTFYREPTTTKGVLTLSSNDLIIQKIDKMKLRAIQNCTGLLRMKDMDHQDTTLHAFDCMENCESLIGIQLVQGKTRGFTRMEDFHGLNVTFNLSCMVQKYPKDSYGFMVFTRDFTFNVLHPEKEFMNALSWENQRIVLGRYPNFYALADLNEEVRFRVEINDQVFSFNKHHGCEHEEPLFMDEVPKLRFRMVRTHHVEKLTYCRSMVSLTQLQVQKNYLVFECLEGTCLRPLEAYFVSSETKDKEVDGIHVLHDQPMVMTFHCKYLRTWQTLETVQLKKHLRFMIKSSLLNREIPFLSIQNFEEVGQHASPSTVEKFRIDEV